MFVFLRSGAQLLLNQRSHMDRSKVSNDNYCGVLSIGCFGEFRALLVLKFRAPAAQMFQTLFISQPQAAYINPLR